MSAPRPAAVRGDAARGEPDRARDLEITLDGRPVPARAGATVGAALTDAGVRSWRSTRRGGRPRGLFCGIGICFDCLVTVEGRPNQRACLVPVRDGLAVTTQEGVGREP